MNQSREIAFLTALESLDEAYLAEAEAAVPTPRFTARHTALIAAAVLAVAVMLAMPMLRTDDPLPPVTTDPAPPDSGTDGAPQTTEAPVIIDRTTGHADCTTQAPETSRPAEETTAPSTSVSTTTAPVGIGGPDSGGPNDILFCAKRLDSIDGNFIDLVDQDALFAWMASLNGIYENRPIGGLMEYTNVYSFIKQFNIPKEVAIEKFTYLQELYAGRPAASLFLTPDEVELLYTADEGEIIAYFLRDNAIYHNGMLFNAKWIHTHTEEDYRAWGLPEEEVARVKAACAAPTDPHFDPVGTQPSDNPYGEETTFCPLLTVVTTADPNDPPKSPDTAPPAIALP